jgi:membrane protein implicated in regulation of membrane protease activity
MVKFRKKDAAMRFNIRYDLKLFLIVVCSGLFLAMVESAPDMPLQFLLFTAADAVLVRFLWLSARRDEKRRNRRAVRAKKGGAEARPVRKKAA